LPGSIRILLIEDDTDDAALISGALRQAGWEPVITRVEGEQAFREQVTAGGWSVVIADVEQPMFGAEQALQVVQELKSDTPVIVVSGKVGEEAAVDLLRAGASDFVGKGNLQRLAESLEREMRQETVRREARAATEAMRQSEERLDAFVRSAMDAIVSCDEEQRVVLFNPAAERVFGWAAEEVMGERLDVLLPERYRWIHSAHMRDFGISGVTNRTMANLAPLSGRRKDGSEFPIEVTISQATVGGARYYTAVVRDISERRRLEGELLQAQKMEAIGRLAGGIAHDFNNLLTAITGYTEIALMEAGDVELETTLREVLSAAERASSLTKQLLTLSRKQTSEVKVLDPNDVVAEIHNMLYRVLGEDIELVSSLDESVGRIRADHGQLNQILLNLAVNARDAMPEGGRLEIRTFSRAFAGNENVVPWPGEYAAISVSDSGTGIPEEDRARIFEPFYTTKPQGKGTGLGLSIVRTILETHHGVVTVEDAPGRGTCFTLYFPADKGELDIRRSPVRSYSSAGSETVVLIEDDDSLRQLETVILRRHGYTVHSFGRPVDALSAALPYVDMLVADVVLPGMSGPAAAASMRKKWPQLKVLFLSGYTGEALADLEALPEGHSLLQKPFGIQELAERVRELLDVQVAS
jgi:PAS domain S-box-containing protein